MKKTKYYILVLIGAVLLNSCDNILDVAPQQSIELDEALDKPDALYAILIDNYDIFQDLDMFGSDLVVLPEVMGDNFEYNGNRGTYRRQFNHEFRWHMGLWSEAYKIITQANIVIEAEEKNIFEDETQKNNIIGQAYAQRAVAYFCLMNVYAYSPTALPANPEQNKGGVPLILKAQKEFGQIEFSARAGIDDVYQQIRDDLDKAIDLLDNSNSTKFLTEAGTQAIASRVALYQGDYTACINYANDAINAGVATFSTRENYLNDWLTVDHPEALFILTFNETEPQGQDGPHNLYTCQFTTSAKLVEGDGDHTPSNFVLNYITSNSEDIRNSILRAVEDVPGTSPRNDVGTLEMIKFNGKGGVNWSDPIPVVRLTEMYLNIAEAAARQSDWPTAQTNLDLIKQRAYGSTFVPTTSTGATLINEILLERRLELLGEGHRFFDLKRNGLDIDKTSPNLTTGPGVVISFEDPRILAPIPTSELDLNEELEQNYNY